MLRYFDPGWTLRGLAGTPLTRGGARRPPLERVYGEVIGRSTWAKQQAERKLTKGNSVAPNRGVIAAALLIGIALVVALPGAGLRFLLAAKYLVESTNP